MWGVFQGRVLITFYPLLEKAQEILDLYSFHYENGEIYRLEYIPIAGC